MTCHFIGLYCRLVRQHILVLVRWSVFIWHVSKFQDLEIYVAHGRFYVCGTVITKTKIFVLCHARPMCMHQLEDVKCSHLKASQGEQLLLYLRMIHTKNVLRLNKKWKERKCQKALYMKWKVGQDTTIVAFLYSHTTVSQTFHCYYINFMLTVLCKHV